MKKIRTDILWHSPAEMASILTVIPDDHCFIVLAENKSGAYPTFLVWKEKGVCFMNTSLSDFTAKEFDPHAFQMLAIVAIQNNKE